MKEKKNIDDLIRDAAEGFEPAFQESSWEQFKLLQASKQPKWKTSLNNSARFFNRYLLQVILVSLITLAAFTFFYFKGIKGSKILANKSETSNETSIFPEKISPISSVHTDNKNEVLETAHKNKTVGNNKNNSNAASQTEGNNEVHSKQSADHVHTLTAPPKSISTKASSSSTANRIMVRDIPALGSKKNVAKDYTSVKNNSSSTATDHIQHKNLKNEKDVISDIEKTSNTAKEKVNISGKSNKKKSNVHKAVTLSSDKKPKDQSDNSVTYSKSKKNELSENYADTKIPSPSTEKPSLIQSPSDSATDTQTLALNDKPVNLADPLIKTPPLNADSVPKNAVSKLPSPVLQTDSNSFWKRLGISLTLGEALYPEVFANKGGTEESGNGFDFNWYGGLQLDFKIKENLDIYTHIVYKERTVNIQILEKQNTFDFDVSDQDYKLNISKLQYLEIPLCIGYKLAAKHNLYAGPVFSYLINTTASVKNFTDNETTAQDGYANGINTFNYGLLLGYSLELPYHLRLNALFDYQLNSVTDKNYYENTSSNMNMGLRFGISYKLK